MTKIHNWEELSKVKRNGNMFIRVYLDDCWGEICSQNDDDDYYYLSTHTFYSKDNVVGIRLKYMREFNNKIEKENNMNKFNWDLINQPNIVVYCRTEEQAKELLTEAHKNGFKWDSKKEHSNISNYDVYLSDTCYHIHNGIYCNTECAKRLYYKILKFEECKII